MIEAMIRAEGPISVERYFELCASRYYATREPFGAGGDFITAPEYSPLFGEMIGVWCATVFEAMGRPAGLRLIELGPGRGTLMADVLRASRLEASVHLVEASPLLRKEQRARLGRDVHWHDTLGDVPDGPAILLANEFFDALPVQQFEWRDGGWRERMVGLGADGELMIGLGARASRPQGVAADGDIIETSPARDAIAREIARRQCHALIIDYGHARSGFGDTVQAMRNHRFHPILEDPGYADITAHVDFERFSRVVAEAGALPHGPITQGAFLKAMGIEVRAAALKARANAAQATALDDALARLTGDDTMGRLFKALAVTPVNSPQPYPFGFA